MVCEKATGAVDGGHARRDGLVQRQRTGIAVMWSRCLELLFSVLSLNLFAFPVGYLFLLLQRAMALFVDLPVAIEGAASAVEWLGVHDASRPVPEGNGFSREYVSRNCQVQRRTEGGTAEGAHGMGKSNSRNGERQAGEKRRSTTRTAYPCCHVRLDTWHHRDASADRGKQCKTSQDDALSLWDTVG